MRRIATICLLSCLAACAGTETGDQAMDATSQPSAEAGVSIMNTNCPVHPEHEVDPNVTVDHDGKTIGFCCNGCREGWAEMTGDERAMLIKEISGGN